MVPCRNEAGYIGPCLESIVRNDYPQHLLEVLVVDGMSTDGTREVIDDYARRYPNVRRLDNPRGITPCALNIGVRASAGQVIMRMDAHAEVQGDYIRRCVEALEDYGADNVGGIIRTLPRHDTLIGRAIAAAISHPFGVGNAYSRIHTKEPVWFEALFCGCYRAEVFTRVGLFNERLTRGQDMEFNLRLKHHGGRGLLVPTIVSTYYARSDVRSFLRHNWSNGVWAILPFADSAVTPVSWRHLVPLAFVTALLVLAGVAPLSFVAALLLVTVTGAYLSAATAAAASIAWRERRAGFLLVMPVVFALLHVPYGLGSIWGAVLLGQKLLARVISGQPQPQPPVEPELR